ncbi:MAG: hypothetical protein CBD54_001720 [Alphaproteobacteria bacterium TMED194]|nr:MAG: hypothetical protein CBD54_001720 [Alphaproteobacteria bacterium TMED194]
MNIFTQNKNLFSYNVFILFALAFLVRSIYLILLNPSPEKLIEDELLYWNATHTYLDTGFLEKSILAERMFGIFIYVKMLLILSLKNLKVYLIIQSALDSINCFTIYKIGSLIFPKQKLYIYLSAILSPLMIILSSQVLSETIFLFFFTLFLYFSVKIILEKNNLYYKIAMAGLFLGFSTSIRSITYPLIYLSILPFIVILIKKNIFKYKIIFSCIIFLFFSVLPISSRVYENIKFNNSFSLTSQAGSHLAYWIAPLIISETKNINRTQAIEVVNEIANKYTLTDNYYKNDKILRQIGFEVLSEINKVDIILHWVKGGLVNLVAPSILLDKNLRSLLHPSYYETGSIFLWLKLILSNSEYYKYLTFLSVSFLSCIFSIISLILGPVYIYKNNRMIFYLTTLYALYFLTITGPVLSPKYIFPILPCVFLYQGITIFKLVQYLTKLRM